MKINPYNSLNRIKEGNCMIIYIDVVKSFDKSQYPLVIKKKNFSAN